jgi:hypothetical protein
LDKSQGRVRERGRIGLDIGRLTFRVVVIDDSRINKELQLRIDIIVEIYIKSERISGKREIDIGLVDLVNEGVVVCD